MFIENKNSKIKAQELSSLIEILNKTPYQKHALTEDELKDLWDLYDES